MEQRKKCMTVIAHVAWCHSMGCIVQLSCSYFGHSLCFPDDTLYINSFAYLNELSVRDHEGALAHLLLNMIHFLQFKINRWIDRQAGRWIDRSFRQTDR